MTHLVRPAHPLDRAPSGGGTGRQPGFGGGRGGAPRSRLLRAEDRFGGIVGEHAVADEAGVVDHGVDRTELVGRRLHQPLGSGILLPAQREPIVTAKAVATLDLLSAGRVDLGVGFGWNEDEMENHGVTLATRRAVAGEHVAAMRALWTQEVASYAGDHVSFTPSWSYPKPVQGSVPVLVGGGSGPKLLAAVVAYADGWIPVGGAGLADAVPRLHAALEEAGRDPSTLRIVLFGSLPTPGKLAHFAAIGVTEVVCRVPSAGRDEALRSLDEIAGVWADYRAG